MSASAIPSLGSNQASMDLCYTVKGSIRKGGRGSESLSHQFDLTQPTLDLRIPTPRFGWGPVMPYNYGDGLGALLAHNTFVTTLRMTQGHPYIPGSTFSVPPIEEGAVGQLSFALLKNVTLKTLEINGQEVGFRLSGREIELISGALRHNSTLTSLDISGSGRVFAHRYISQLYPNTPSLVGPAMADILTHNGSLRSLSFANNSLPADGLIAVSEGLRLNQTLQTLDISDTMLGVEKDGYAVALLAMLTNTNPSLTSLTLSHHQVALAGFEGIRDVLTANPNLLDIAPRAGESWLPDYRTFQFVDHETLTCIQPIFIELTQFEQGVRELHASSSSDAASSSAVSPRDAVIERMSNYKFIYRSVCESILRQLPQEDQNRIYLNVWLFSGQPDDPNFGQENAFTNWSIFHRSVEAAGLKDRFPVLFP